MHARLAAPCQHRLSLARPFSSCATVLHAWRVRASVVFFPQIFSVITQNLTSGIPQFRILQEARLFLILACLIIFIVYITY